MSTSTKEHSRSKIIKKENALRLLRDVKDILKNPLHDTGIYYKHDETDVLKGYALIIGPADTPYENGFFFFEIYYSPEYPYAPPNVIYCTNGENIRFNPNLHRKGKVCLSILNTWRGEQWTSCDTIRSVLLHLCGVFTPIPLLNEPGMTDDDPDVPKYTKAIEYATLNIAIGDIMTKRPGVYQPFFDMFYEEVDAHFRKKRTAILDKISRNIETQSRIHASIRNSIYISIYNMFVDTDYSSLFTKIETI
jgi:ubiquitin-conjugating enzyme E2 Z